MAETGKHEPWVFHLAAVWAAVTCIGVAFIAPAFLKDSPSSAGGASLAIFIVAEAVTAPWLAFLLRKAPVSATTSRALSLFPLLSAVLVSVVLYPLNALAFVIGFVPVACFTGPVFGLIRMIAFRKGIAPTD